MMMENRKKAKKEPIRKHTATIRIQSSDDNDGKMEVIYRKKKQCMPGIHWCDAMTINTSNQIIYTMTNIAVLYLSIKCHSNVNIMNGTFVHITQVNSSVAPRDKGGCMVCKLNNDVCGRASDLNSLDLTYTDLK